MHKMVVNWKVSPFDVYIGRGTKWGNPYHIGKDGDRDEVCDKYIALRGADPAFVEMVKRELAGKVLGCSCFPLRCHGDWLAEVAGGGPATRSPMAHDFYRPVAQPVEQRPHKPLAAGSYPARTTMADPSGEPRLP